MDTPTIKPIETHYAGCRFRSRLEARWAVFFDTLKIKWEYEREGYEVEDRLYLTGTDAWYYLPDFWLPEYELHAEVKGSFDSAGFLQFLSAAADLSSPRGGCGGGNDSLILGPIPLPDNYSAYPIRLHMHKGDLQTSPFWAGSRFYKFVCWEFNRGVIASDTGELYIEPHDGNSLLSGYPDKIGDKIANGYRAARSARFEHGEKG